jgi:hypothetical protein
MTHLVSYQMRVPGGAILQLTHFLFAAAPFLALAMLQEEEREVMAPPAAKRAPGTAAKSHAAAGSNRHAAAGNRNTAAAPAAKAAAVRSSKPAAVQQQQLKAKPAVSGRVGAAAHRGRLGGMSLQSSGMR